MGVGRAAQLPMGDASRIEEGGDVRRPEEARHADAHQIARGFDLEGEFGLHRRLG